MDRRRLIRHAFDRKRKAGLGEKGRGGFGRGRPRAKIYRRMAVRRSRGYGLLIQ